MGLCNRHDDYDRLCCDCVEYYRRFDRRFGSTKCKDITGIRFKQGYDIRRFFLKGIRCLRVVYTSIESFFDIIQSPRDRVDSGDACRISPPFGSEKFHCAGVVLSRIAPYLTPDLSSALKATQGFSGGIAFQGDVCGALMGGVFAIGVVYGTEVPRTHPTRLFRAGLVAMKEGSRVFQNEDLHPSFRTSLRVGRLYREFVSRFGSADCADILGKTDKSKSRDFCEEIAQSTARFTLGLIDV